jgi:branched-chain amino acid transport system substrate-binding protein
MKRFLYFASAVVMLLSSVMAGKAFAANTHSAADKGTITVQLCSSGPYGVPALRDLWQGTRNGVDIAMRVMAPKLTKVGVRLGPQVRLDDAKPDGSTYSTDVEHTNALKCIGNKNAIGYVGTLNSGAALVSEPVLNRAHMVMISPANTNPSLTDPHPYTGVGGRQAEEPATYNHSLKWVTYYRTVTTDALQGPAGAVFAAQILDAKSVYIVDDKLTYGAGLSATFQTEAQRLSMRVLGHGHIDSSSPAAEAQTAQSLASTIKSKNPDIVYCGCNSETVPALPRDLRADGYSKPFMGGDALTNTAWVTNTKQGSVNNFATSVGPPASKASGHFRALYKKYFAGFFSKPGIQSYDATAYDAASIILTAVYQAAKAHKLTGNATHMRTAIIPYVRYMHYCGATGCMRFDNNGDTTNRILSVYKVSGSDWAFLREVTAPKGFKPAP